MLAIVKIFEYPSAFVRGVAAKTLGITGVIVIRIMSAECNSEKNYRLLPVIKDKTK